MDVWNASWNSNKAGSRRAQLICGAWPNFGRRVHAAPAIIDCQK